MVSFLVKLEKKLEVEIFERFQISFFLKKNAFSCSSQELFQFLLGRHFYSREKKYPDKNALIVRIYSLRFSFKMKF